MTPLPPPTKDKKDGCLSTYEQLNSPAADKKKCPPKSLQLTSSLALYLHLVTQHCIISATLPPTDSNGTNSSSSIPLTLPQDVASSPKTKLAPGYTSSIAPAHFPDRKSKSSSSPYFYRCCLRGRVSLLSFSCSLFRFELNLLLRGKTKALVTIYRASAVL